MRIVGAELRRVYIPFKRRFDHAAAARAGAERIYVGLEGEGGAFGIGEIMPRAYLTGETLDEVFSTTAPARAQQLIGKRFADQAEVIACLVQALDEAGRKLALAAGFEAALLDLAERHFGAFDYAALLGPKRTLPPGRCVTIGLTDDPKTLRRHALEARIAKASVVKVKVAGEGDAESVRALRRHLGAIPIRLDANGTLTLKQADRLLGLLKDTGITSIEQPLPADETELAAKLRALFRTHGVPIMADESACSAADVDRIGEEGGYQLVNIRVGKCGGLLGARSAIEAARRQGLDIVGGTLVGESTPLDRQGALLLEHTEDMPYMEGLGQPGWLLAADPTAGDGIGEDGGDGWPPAGESASGVTAGAFWTSRC